MAVSQKERPFFHADPDGPPYVVGVLEGSVEKIVDVLGDPPVSRFPGGAIGQDHDLGIRGDPPDPARQRVTVPFGHRQIHQGDGKRLAGQQIEPLLDRPRRMGIAPFSPEELREFFEVGRPLPDEQDLLSVHRYSSPPGGNSRPLSPPVSPTAVSLFIGRKTEFIHRFREEPVPCREDGFSQARAVTTPTPRASGLSAEIFLYPAARNREAISRAV